MTNVEATNCKIIQSYGGLKSLWFEATVTAGDVITFPADFAVSGIKMAVMQDSADGVTYPAIASGTDDITLTVGTGPSADALVGTILFRSY